jgi:hypothetical protein
MPLLKIMILRFKMTGSFKLRFTGTHRARNWTNIQMQILDWQNIVLHLKIADEKSGEGWHTHRITKK